LGIAPFVHKGKVMTGWVMIIVLAAAVFLGLLKLAKLPRKTWEPLATVLVLGMAGYAFQGRPDLPDAPGKQGADRGKEAAALIEMRSVMDQNYGGAKKWLIPADGFARDGNFQLSAIFLKSGLHENPYDADLWSALGVQLMLASNGEMSAPAKFAFERARKLQPLRPAPDYFEGLAALFEGRVVDALKLWQGLLDRAPEQARWRPKLQAQVDGVKVMARRMSEQETLPVSSN
jgi:cytochrome c-type biogenesis protein CcmH